MSRREKLLEHVRDNPRNVRAEQLFDVLRGAGVEVRRIGSGTHIGLRRGAARATLAVPHDGGPLRPAYVVNALKTFGLARSHVYTAVRLRPGTAGDGIEVTVRREPSGEVVAEVPSLPGCVAAGDDRARALKGIEDAMVCWLAMAEEG